MKFYYAPMEGITLYPLRNVHHEMFGDNMDRYYTPFLTAAKTYRFKKREQRDVLPEYCRGFDNWCDDIVPQIMGNQSETFIWAAKKLSELGYNEINLNLGCPVATVVTKHKGSGMLENPEYLDEMLYGIYETIDREKLDFKVSLKTRLGLNDVAEIPGIMSVYAKYPIRELTVHSRVRSDFYKGEPRVDSFCEAVNIYRESGGKAHVCYNGSVDSPARFKDICSMISDRLPEEKDIRYMIGRGLVANPALVREINGGDKLKAEELKTYLEKLYVEYEKYIPEDRNVIFKMLEHWAFLYIHFKDCDKYLKAVRKSRSKGEYMAAVNNMFAGCEFII